MFQIQRDSLSRGSIEHSGHIFAVWRLRSILIKGGSYSSHIVRFLHPLNILIKAEA
jgi:hypothetical protein